jgi:hypothetical protein
MIWLKKEKMLIYSIIFTEQKKKQRENTVIAGRLSIQIQLVMFKGVAFNIMEI